MEYINKILEYAFAVFVGSSAVIIFIIKFGVNKFSEIISSKIDLEFNKKLEIYKGEINKKTTISQSRFDKEFEILQYLISSYFDFSSLSKFLLLHSFTLEDNQYVSELKLFTDKCNDITKYFYKNCALIDKDIADYFEAGIIVVNKLKDLAYTARSEYEKCINEHIVDNEYYDSHFTNKYNEMIEISRGLNEVEMNKPYCYKNMITKVREYLNSFEII